MAHHSGLCIPSRGATDAHRRMLRKMDFSILPVLAIVYLFNALDKYVATGD